MPKPVLHKAIEHIIYLIEYQCREAWCRNVYVILVLLDAHFCSQVIV